MASLSRTAVKCARICNGAAPFSSEASSSTLSNGIKVVSTTSGSSSASFGVAVNAGSRNETANNTGASLLLKHMAFKSTTSRSDLRLARDIESAGISVNAVAGREKIVYTASGLPSAFEDAVQAVAETVTTPKLSHWEVKETMADSVAFELGQVTKDPQVLLLEAIHEAAYGRDSPMGRRFFANPKKLTNNDLTAYMSSFFTPSNMTIVGAGIPHDVLVAAAEKGFGGVQGTSSAPAKAKFVGGSSAIHAESPLTHMALTFESGDAAASAVLKEILSRQLQASGAMASAFNLSYSDTGLFGLYGAVNGDSTGILAEQFVSALKAAASADEASVNAAKLAVKTQLAAEADHPTGAVNSLVSGSVSVDAVNAGAVKNFASALLKSNPALSVVGNTYGAPSHATVASML